MSASRRGKVSAGLLPIWTDGGQVQVFIGRMGGPFWARRDRAWTVIKGVVCSREPHEDAARREWVEETGTDVPDGDLVDLGDVRQSGGKTVHAFAVRVAHPAEVQFTSSNTVEIEWPPRSGRMIEIPEIERAEWVSVDDARSLLVAAQVGFLDRIVELLSADHLR